ncbi:MAG: glycosyltransferase family 39 protein [Planctomycetota bacterium]
MTELTQESRRRRLGALAWSLLTAVGTLVLLLGWDRGPDVLVDFGRELYVPWRLLIGEVLHRDIAWFNGPLAPWILEGWMGMFGVSLDALQALNALVIAVGTWLLVSLLLRATGRLAAFTGGLTFLTVFAVAQQEAIGNFHFLSPYSHGITFGFVAALAAIHFLLRGMEATEAQAPSRPRARWFMLSGAAAGAAFLTKAEISLATGAACGVGLVAACLNAPSKASFLRAFASFEVGAAVVVGAAYLRLHAQLEGEGAFRALLGTWPYALDARANGLKFYREMRGTADLAASLARMGVWTAGIGACCTCVLAIGGVIGARIKSARQLAGTPIPAVISFLAAASLTFIALFKVTIQWLMLPLPILLLVRIVQTGRRWLVDRTSHAEYASRMMFLVFALGLLPKVLFAPMARQYGFVLALPGAVVMTSLLVHCIPHWTSHGPGRRWTRWLGEPSADKRLRVRRNAIAAAGFGIVIVFCAANLHATTKRFAGKSVAVGSGADRLWADGFRGVVMAEAAREIVRRTEPEDSVLVLPEGILLNYLTRRRTPTRLVNFMPPELVFFDEVEVVRALEENPPDLVVIVKRPTTDYGHEFFGRGYGETIFGWIKERYESDRRIGGAPFDPDPKTFGAEMWVPREVNRPR